MLFNMIKKTSPLFLGETQSAIMRIGQDTRKRAICVDSEIIRKHILVLGTTGAGKTETLIGLMSNAFAWNSGGVYVDGKGDVSLYAKMAGIAEQFGLQDDLYVLNFMSTKSSANGLEFTSHRFNPFERGDACALTTMLVSLIEDDRPKAGHAERGMLVGRATAMLTGIMGALCYYRDFRGHRLDAAVIRSSLNFANLMKLAYDVGGAPAAIRSSIAAYLSSLPGFQKDKGTDQSPQTLEQHGYLEFQFTRVLSIMADVYGHIFCAGGSDVDFDDIYHNRRFVVVLLPALEKAHDEIAILGKTVMASIKSVLGGTLSRPIVGNWNNAVPNMDLPPFLCVFDEAAYYPIQGIDLMAAQARSLNVGLIFGSQDMDALFSRNGLAARAITESTSTKIVMRSECIHPEVESLLNGAEPGRDDVEQFIKTKTNSKGHRLFVPAQTLVKDLDEGQFLLLNSSKVIAGVGNYVNCLPSYLSPVRFNSHKRVAGRLVELERGKDGGVDGHPSGPPPIPPHLAPLLNAAECNSPVATVVACLKVLSGTDPSKSEAIAANEETILIGA